jgi:hypothetical protein
MAKVGADELAIAVQRLVRVDVGVHQWSAVELLAERGADVLRDLGESWQLSQMLLTLEEGEQRELLDLSPRMGCDTRLLVVGRTVEGVQFGGTSDGLKRG